MNTIQEESFNKEDFTAGLEAIEYEECSFHQCSFAGADLSRITFVDCEFDGCDLSNIKITDSAMREVRFKNCKLIGAHFDECNDFLFEVAFEDCILNFSSFYKKSLKKTRLIRCSMYEVDLVEADMSESLFYECDFAGATFDRTNLEKADLSTSFNFLIDPENNRLKKAQFSQSELAGLLFKYGIVVK
ncbi:pentapeptide repeat-containing protein [Fulvivirga maritima]|uniref:pentapeptide repeat-containing protein n=1 Tax=Fulvivirga maritima TaxID=2904247 RepID=UPI001F33E4BC|nr:pentapeptide repeat-containing protein [Fulvivirga maritima]UII26940.1 pentapeptide repeat-containing protein [Fulvivirga maritima]